RFSDPTLAHQRFRRGIDVDLIEKMNEEATGGLKPNLTFLIDLPVEVAFERLKGKKKDRLEMESLEFHRKVREGFLKIAEKEKDRVVIIDGRKSVDEIFSEVVKEVQRRLGAL
ncbi:MAG: dTMP kinase, partial [Desulfurobacteriaceae bacterium]